MSEIAIVQHQSITCKKCGLTDIDFIGHDCENVLLQQAEAAIQRVRDLHRPFIVNVGLPKFEMTMCRHCGLGGWMQWPCQTIKALDTAVRGEDNRYDNA